MKFVKNKRKIVFTLKHVLSVHEIYAKNNRYVMCLKQRTNNRKRYILYTPLHSPTH